MAMIKTTKYFFGKILHSQVLSSMDILFLKREFLKLWKWPRQTAKSVLCVGLNVSNGLKTEANFSGCRGVRWGAGLWEGGTREEAWKELVLSGPGKTPN